MGFSGDFLLKKCIPFHEDSAPLYLLSFLGIPREKLYRPTDQVIEAKALTVFKNDLDKLPFSRVYDLISSYNVDIEYNPNMWYHEGYSILDSGRRKIVVGNFYSEKRDDFKWCANLLLHELYHFVEADERGMEDYMRERWELSCRQNNFGTNEIGEKIFKPAFYVGWADEGVETEGVWEIAELFSMMALAQGLEGIVRPLHEKILHQID